MTEMASRRDTAGTARIFHTAAGKDVELTGPYGWKIDVAGEVQALAALIQAGPAAGPVDREPVYAMTAASRTAPDWGNTYAEVDLTGQHVYMFQEGNLVWDAPCVTGNISKNYDTPAGIYSLTYKEKDRILREPRRRTEPMSTRAMWITGCPLTEALVSMTPHGEANSAAPSSRPAEAMAASTFRRKKLACSMT